MGMNLLLPSFFLFILGSALVFGSWANESPAQRRERVLGELSDAIDEKAAHGDYNCCIDPPCTMCYMGNWIWNDGSCHCDEMISQGKYDDVCPQCKKALEQGICKSVAE